MNNSTKKYTWLPIGAIVFIVAVKLLFLLTHHIQEDAFITWRVAQNLLDYGVIGFNGEERISASTTHLYMFVSYIFNLILGKTHFMYPLLIFNSILFTIGSYWLSKMLFKKPTYQAIFIVLFGILPPAIKISILGMEYGILFFLEMGLLYWAFNQKKKWAYIIFPILIMMTRIDTVIFLGIVFLVDLLANKKIKWLYILGGVLGVITVLSFNWFYFHEIVNNTIVAKKLTYDDSFTFQQNLAYFNLNYGNFWGMLKIPGNFNPITIIILLFEFICFILLMKDKEKRERNILLATLFIFGWVKQFIFLTQKSLFDWYYWVPQIVLFIPVIVLVLEKRKNKNLWLACLIIFYILPMMAFQAVHSIATGNGEWNYRKSIGIFLDEYEKDKNQYIFLEPAGYVPYYSGLKTIDEVGLVDKKIHEEIIKDKENYRFNTIKNRKPKYILSYKDLSEDKNAYYYNTNYRLLKQFRINNYLHHDNPIIQKIYQLKPSGTDYNLYERR